MEPAAFCLAGGDQPTGAKAALCVCSIREWYPDTPIYVYVPTHEKQSPAIEEPKITIISEPLEIPQYPISTKVQALVEAERRTDERPIWLLDSDTIVRGQLPAVHADLAIKPIDWGDQYWATNDASLWRDIYERLDIPYSHETVETTVDNKSIVAYYNAGVVGSNLPAFGQSWLSATKELYGDIPESKHADQVALAVCASQYERQLLDEVDNFPLNLRLRLPNDVRVVHYHSSQNLLKSPQICREYYLVREYINFWYTDVQFPAFLLKQLYNRIKNYS